MQELNKLDQARIEWISSHPESLVEVGDWEIVSCCANCHTAIPAEDEILYKRSVFGNKDKKTHEFVIISRTKVRLTCRNCTALRPFRIKAGLYQRHEFGPLPHYTKRRRWIVTEREYRRTIFGRLKLISSSGLWEEEILKQ